MMKLSQLLRMFFFIVALLGLFGTVLAADKPVKASQQELDRGASIAAREKAVSGKEKDLARREKEHAEIRDSMDALYAGLQDVRRAVHVLTLRKGL